MSNVYAAVALDRARGTAAALELALGSSSRGAAERLPEALRFATGTRAAEDDLILLCMSSMVGLPNRIIFYYRNFDIEILQVSYSKIFYLT